MLKRNVLGVILRHKNLALATQSNMFGMSLPEDVTLLSYLPLAHIYEVTFCDRLAFTC